MPNLPQKKVGIIACSGEEMAEGTVTRLAALRVLEQLRPADTVTICLPLFLAGGEGDRAFARFYPTIAIDGCDKRCAARATEMYSAKPAASLVVTDLLAERGLDRPAGLRRLNEAGQQAVTVTAEAVAETVDELLGRRWNRRTGDFIELDVTVEPAAAAANAACACSAAIPMQKIEVDGQVVNVVALPLIFQQFRQAGKAPAEASASELLEAVRLYHPIPAGSEAAYRAALLQEYTVYCAAEALQQPSTEATT